MGWSYKQGATKRDVIKDVTQSYTHSDGGTFSTLKQCVRGNVLWCVHEVKYPAPEGVNVAVWESYELHRTKRWISCTLLGSDPGYGWGYKAMDECMHPYYYSCPLSYLDMAPATCQEWRDAVRARAENRARVRQARKVEENRRSYRILFLSSGT